MLTKMDVSEIGPQLVGKTIVTAGWVLEKRDLGKIKFLIISDRDGAIQVTWKSDQGDAKLKDIIDSLRQNDVVKVSGEVAKSEIAKSGVEIFPKDIEILNRCSHPLPIDISGRIKSGLSTRLDYRPLDLVRSEFRSIFILKSEVLRLMRDFFYKNGFVEVITPRIIVSATEGGASLFKVDYFGKVAYLAQSPQLYKEQLTLSLKRVFEIGTFFRAEPFDTNRHLNEFASVDIECAFCDMYDVMNIAEEMLRFVINGIKENARDKLDILGVRLSDIDKSFTKITYRDLLLMLRKDGIDVAEGEDIGSEKLKPLVDKLDNFYFITEWPESTKPFYIKTGENGVTQSFDLMYRDLELGSGGTREENKFRLIENMKKRGLDLKSFESHLKIFDYGIPPHAGWGIGLDRVLMPLLGLENIREAVLYPRDRFRIEP